MIEQYNIILTLSTGKIWKGVFHETEESDI